VPVFPPVPPLVPPFCVQPMSGIERMSPRVNGRDRERSLRCIPISPSGNGAGVDRLKRTFGASAPSRL
jgi:hypothetical protein